nr:Crp/Fnr family transcriptional regulator [uncultured Neokomagataea sp.]
MPMPSGHEEPADRCIHCAGRQFSICDAIDEADLGILSRESSKMTVPTGRGFIEEGEEARDFFVVTDGTIRLFTLLPDGRRQVTGFAERGSFLGLAAEDRYAFGAEALTPTHLCRFPHVAMERLTERFPHLENRLRREASRELARSQARMTLLGRKSAQERLASFIIERIGCHHRVTGSDNTTDLSLTLPMPRSDIADYLGLTIETVSRAFSLFKREGLINIHGITHIDVLRPERLLRIAEGSV